jgi:CO/xanthine dehydrogenase Mo-binding subunit
MSQSQYKILGSRVPDVRAVERVTGATVYSVDVIKPGMLTGRVVRSPYAHAEIVNIDTSAAESLPGVKAVVTYEDAPAIPFPGYNLYVLDNTVRFVGEEVAAVAAETEEIADQAVKLVKVDYKPLPQVTSPQAALLPNAPQLFPGGNLNAPYNPLTSSRGDVNAGFSQADTVYENTYTVPFQPVASLRQFTCVAEWDGQNLTIYDSGQVIYTRQGELAALLNLPNNNVRVISPYEGGGFGEDNEFRYIPLAALLAMKSGRTVRMLMPQDYAFEAAPKKRHAVTMDVKIGTMSDGNITAMQVNTLFNKGGYLAGGTAVPIVGAECVFNGYRTPNMAYTCTSVFTNNPSAGAYRGYGGLQTNFAVQAAMDDLAAKLGMDPTDFHAMNCIRPDDVLSIYPYTVDFSTIGGSAFIESINQGKAAINWSRWTPNGFATSQPNVLGGLGMSLLTYGFGASADTASAQVNINSDGTVSVYMGTADLGGGQPTTMAMIIAEELGANLSDITMYTGDTDYPPAPLLGTFASRTTMIAGNGAKSAAANAKQKLLNAAAAVLGVNASHLDTQSSSVVNTSTGTSVPFAQIMEKLGSTIEAYGTYVHTAEVSSTGFQLGACFAEVNVDTWTGKISVVNEVLVQDYGQVLNQLGVEGQMAGGAIQSLGYAIREDYVIDANTTQAITRDWLYYQVPTIMDAPDIVTIELENPDPRGPFGAKGGGESMIVCNHSAIRNAIANAIGVRFNSLPITPQMVIEGLKAKNGGAT